MNARTLQKLANDIQKTINSDLRWNVKGKDESYVFEWSYLDTKFYVQRTYFPENNEDQFFTAIEAESKESFGYVASFKDAVFISDFKYNDFDEALEKITKQIVRKANNRY